MTGVSKFEYKWWRDKNTDEGRAEIARSMDITVERVKEYMEQVKAGDKRQFTPKHENINIAGKIATVERGRRLNHDIVYGDTVVGKKRWAMCRKCYEQYGAITLQGEKCKGKPDAKPGSRSIGYGQRGDSKRRSSRTWSAWTPTSRG